MEVVELKTLVQSDLLTTREVADILRVSQNSVKNWIYQGKIKAIKTPGGDWRIPKDVFLLSLEGNVELERIFQKGSLLGKKLGITEEKIQELLEAKRYSKRASGAGSF
jgi:excisionase family DNA binding protein